MSEMGNRFNTGKYRPTLAPYSDAVRACLEETDQNLASGYSLVMQSLTNQSTRGAKEKLAMAAVVLGVNPREVCQVLEFGAKKYSTWNWTKGLHITSVYDSLLRHLFAIGSGELIDPESGLPHRAHIGCNILFIEYFLNRRPDLDDRAEQLGPTYL